VITEACDIGSGDVEIIADRRFRAEPTNYADFFMHRFAFRAPAQALALFGANPFSYLKNANCGTYFTGYKITS